MRSAEATTELRVPVRVIFALGSNLGDRRYELELGIHVLRGYADLVRRSSVIETVPIDSPTGAGMFLNMVVAGFTRAAPRELLDAIHRHERSRGRRRLMHNEPRRIDIDIIRYGSEKIRNSTLAIPHPRFAERPFVIEPMRELGLIG